MLDDKSRLLKWNAQFFLPNVLHISLQWWAVPWQSFISGQDQAGNSVYLSSWFTALNAIKCQLHSRTRHKSSSSTESLLKLIKNRKEQDSHPNPSPMSAYLCFQFSAFCFQVTFQSFLSFWLENVCKMSDLPGEAQALLQRDSALAGLRIENELIRSAHSSLLTILRQILKLDVVVLSAFFSVCYFLNILISGFLAYLFILWNLVFNLLNAQWSSLQWLFCFNENKCWAPSTNKQH